MENDRKWFTIKEIAEIFQLTVPVVRFHIRESSERVHLDKENFRKGSGTKGDTFREDAVFAIMGGPPAMILSETERRLFSQTSSSPAIKLFSTEKKESRLTGILASRELAHDAYFELASDMITRDSDLRLRCVTGTDFFTTVTIPGKAMLKRMQDSRQSQKILLVHPYGRARDVRSGAEGEGHRPDSSQFSRDSETTLRFL